jgi:hypothetical protein
MIIQQANDPPDKNKRKRKNVDFPSFGNVDECANYGKFFVLENAESDKTMKNVNPFLVGKFIENLFPKGVYGTRRMGNGNILVHGKSETYANSTVGEHSLSLNLNIKIKVSLHVNLNQSKGKIFCPELSGLTDEEILEELKKAKVIAVRRMMKKGEKGTLEETDNIVLTFDRPQIPDTLSVGYLKLRVSQYYDSPMQCLKCQKYGHTKKRCKETKELCRNCSLELPHESCVNKKCVNCGQGHASNDNSCEVRRKEQVISKLMVDKKLSYAAAKREFEKISDSSVKNATFAQKLQEQETNKRNSPPVTHEQFTEFMLEFKKMREEISFLNEQIRLRDELLLAHGIVSKTVTEIEPTKTQTVIEPTQITSQQTGDGPVKTIRSSRNQQPKYVDRPYRSRSNSRNPTSRRTLKPGQSSSADPLSDDDVSVVNVSSGLPKNVTIHRSQLYNDTNN